MKKSITIVLVFIAGLILVSAIYAYATGGSHGMGHHTTPDIDLVKKFQKETLSLRDELIIKKLELQKEYSKTAPDRSRISTLRKEIIDIETKIQEKADAVGLSAWGGGMMGHGMMMGRGMAGMGCQCPMEQ